MIHYQNQREHFTQNEFGLLGQINDLDESNLPFLSEIIEPDDKEKVKQIKKMREDLVSGIRVTTTCPTPSVEGVSSGESIYRVPEKVKMEEMTGKNGGLSRLNESEKKDIKPVKKTLKLKCKKVVKPVNVQEEDVVDVDEDLSIPTTIPLNKQYLYKTEFCRSWMESRTCKYGDK